MAIKWVVKVGLPLDGNEFADPAHVAHEAFDDSWDAYAFTQQSMAQGYRVNVYKGAQHIGTFEHEGALS